MSLYTYHCDGLDCQHEQDVRHSIKEDPEIRCERCGRIMRRVISGGTCMIFRGPGFHVNDYPKGKPKPEYSGTADL